MRCRSQIAAGLAIAVAVGAGFLIAPARALATSDPIIVPTTRPPAAPYVDYLPPSRPGPLRIDFSDGITLTWGASTDNSGSVFYEVYAGGRLIATVRDTRYVYSSSLPTVRIQPYFFAVRAVDAAGNASLKVFGPEYPEPPTNVVVAPPQDLTVEDWTRGYIRLVWKEPAAISLTSLPLAGYGVSVSGSARPIVTPVIESGNTFLVLPAPPPGRYRFAVWTIDAAGNTSRPITVSVVRE